MKITVIYHDDPDGLWAESPDVPGWCGAVAPTLQELQERVSEGVRFALEDDGVDADGVEIAHELPVGN